MAYRRVNLGKINLAPALAAITKMAKDVLTIIPYTMDQAVFLSLIG
jgi:hypothetical protein